MASMYRETGQQQYMDQALTLVNWHWSHRNPTTNLIPDAPSTYPRYDSTHSFTTITGPYTDQLLNAYELTNEPTFLNRAVTYLKAYDQYAWDDGGADLLGHAPTRRNARPRAAARQRLRRLGPLRPRRPLEDDDLLLRVSAEHRRELRPRLRADRRPGAVDRGPALGDRDLQRSAGATRAAIRRQHPGGHARRGQTGGSYAEDYGRVISFFTNLYNATGKTNAAYLQTAEQVAQDAVDKLYVNDIFRGHPAEPYYETTKGVGVLLESLLDLDTVSTKRPVVTQIAPADRRTHDRRLGPRGRSGHDLRARRAGRFRNPRRAGIRSALRLDRVRRRSAQGEPERGDGSICMPRITSATARRSPRRPCS